jgi:membrane protein
MSWARAVFAALRDAARLFQRRGGRLLSGAIAFYALLSIVPMLLIVLHVASRLTDEHDSRSLLVREIARWVGHAGAATLVELLDRARQSHQGATASVLSTALVLYGSTRLWSQLQRALDILWGTEKPESDSTAGSVLRQLRKRALAFGLVLFTGIALAALVVGHTLQARLHLAAGSSRVFEALGAFVITTLLFSLIYQVLPHARVRPRDALRGGLLTALLFTFGSLLVSTYVAHKAANSAYGAAGSVVMLMLWVHYSAHVFFYGAALTCVVAAPAAQGSS